MNYRMAAADDIDLLAAQRLRFIEIDEGNDKFCMMRDNCIAYFSKAFANDSCDAVLAEEDGECVGTGIVFYYDSVPSASNPAGRNAYITSLFVEPEYRGRGTGREIMNRLIECAADRGYGVIMLNASEMGERLYRSMGFEDIRNGMILRLDGKN